MINPGVGLKAKLIKQTSLLRVSSAVYRTANRGDEPQNLALKLMFEFRDFRAIS